LYRSLRGQRGLKAVARDVSRRSQLHLRPARVCRVDYFCQLLLSPFTKSPPDRLWITQRPDNEELSWQPAS
jgi:hypothetical protein